MSPNTPEPFPGALPFAGISVERPAFNPNKRRAFGSVPRLLWEHVHLELQLTPEDRHHASPEYLSASLNAASGRGFNGLAFNAAEYSVILLNPESLEEKVSSSALKGHSYSNRLRRQEVAIHAPIHMYTDRNGLQDKHLQIIESLTKERNILDELGTYIRALGRARTTEARIREVTTFAWQTSFANIITIADYQNGWTERQHQGASEALASNLFTGPQNDRMTHWRDMTDLARTYSNRKRILFTQREHVIASRVKILKAKEADLYAKNGITPAS